MKFLKRLLGQYKSTKVRYAMLDYNPYFEEEAAGGVRLEKRYLGKLALPSGFIVACDPLLGLHDALPFTRRMPPGEYPVFMIVAGSYNRRRNALLKVIFSDEKAAQWELAYVPGQAAGGTHDNNIFCGFTTDAGIGCLCDAHTQKHYNAYLERFFRDHPNGDIYDSLFARAFARKHVIEENHSFNFHLPAHPRQNVIMFHTGYGDGIYPAYWGVSESGTICSLVIDFMVI